jgi:hypothetical protein
MSQRKNHKFKTQKKKRQYTHNKENQGWGLDVSGTVPA